MLRRLLIRPGAIGDFILSLAALEFLAADYTEVWCAEQNVPLCRFADSARSIGSAGLDRVGHLNAEDVLERLASFDEIHSWYGTNLPSFRALVEHLPFTFYTALPVDRAMHATEFYCRQVGAPVTLPRLAVGSVKNDGVAVIHPFASNVAKRWPLVCFEELARALAPVAWCAGPEEPFPGAIRIANLYDLACRLAAARLYIGNDSGITHLAAATGIPVVALFGPTDPAVWSPRGPNVRVIANHSLDLIHPEEVLNAIKTLL